MKSNSKAAPKMATFKLGELEPSAYNPRTITADAMTGLTNSIKRFGCVEPIVVNVRGTKNIIIGGHQRYKALINLHGNKYKCMCVTVNLSAKAEKLLNLTLNNPKLQGEFIDELGAYIAALRESIPDSDITALRIAELAADYPDCEKIGNVLDDEIPEPPKKAITKPGDIWLLGEHKLLCGDSTDEKDVARLFGRNRASLFATDPPYCVDYTGKDRPGGGKDWSGVFKENEIEDAKAFIKSFYVAGLKYVKQEAALYLWHAGKRRGMIEQVCSELGILIHQQIIWVKPCCVLTYSLYPWRHEPCLLMWIKGHRPRYRRQADCGTVWTIGYIKEGDPTTPEYYTDVWELDWEGKQRNPGLEHPTVKPVEVFAIPMRVHTKPGDLCYEPFCGSGSQIIAAEKLGRRCFAIEIEPVFCDVAIKRWENWTGRKAKLKRASTGGRVRKGGITGGRGGKKRATGQPRVKKGANRGKGKG